MRDSALSDAFVVKVRSALPSAPAVRFTSSRWSLVRAVWKAASPELTARIVGSPVIQFAETEEARVSAAKAAVSKIFRRGDSFHE